MDTRAKKLATAQLLRKTREVTAANLPIGSSFIPYDILLYLFHCQSTGETLSVKSLFTSLPYSEMGTRYHFKRLIENGWIELVPDANDARIKNCKPTEKFKTRFGAIVEELSKVD